MYISFFVSTQGQEDMETLLNSSFHTNKNYYPGFYEFDIWKSSFFLIIGFCAPLSYSYCCLLVWYEWFSVKFRFRTIINQLNTYLTLVVIIGTIATYSVQFVWLYLGPFPNHKFICDLYLINVRTLNIIVLLQFATVNVLRFLYLYVFKNVGVFKVFAYHFLYRKVLQHFNQKLKSKLKIQVVEYIVLI